VRKGCALVLLANAVSNIVGTLLGGVIYRSLGLSSVFFVFCISSFMFCPFINILIPSTADKTSETTESVKRNLLESYIRILKVPKALIKFLIYLVDSVMWNYLEPVLALRLKNEFNLQTYQNNNVFTIFSFALFIGSILSLYVRNHIDGKK